VYGSEQYVKAHEVNSSGVIIAKNANIIPISEDLIGQLIEFRIGSSVCEICFTNKANLPSKPIIISSYIEGSTLYLGFLGRNFKTDLWHRAEKENLGFSIEVKAKDQVLNFMTVPEIDKIEIDISALDISDGYKVDIVQIV